MKRIRVFLAEDQTILRHSLRAVMAQEADLEVVGEAGDGEAAVQQVSVLQPEVVVMDISLPGLDGEQATRAIKQACPAVKVLVLSVHETKHHVQKLLRAGASGYVVKRSAAGELIQALRAMATEGTYLDRIASARLFGTPKTAPATKPDGEKLTAREGEVLRFIALGYVNKEIAAQLNLSVKTVDTFKTRGMEKLGLHSRVDIVRHALQCGWLTAR